MTLTEIINTYFKGKGLGLSDAEKTMSFSIMRRYLAADYPDIANEMNSFHTPAVAASNIIAILLRKYTKPPKYVTYNYKPVHDEYKSNLIDMFEANYKDILFLQQVNNTKYNELIESFQKEDVKNLKKNKKWK